MKMTSRSTGFTDGGRPLLGPIIAVATVLGLGPGLAAPPTIQIPTEDTFEPGGPDYGPFGFLNGISRSDYMLGDMWGLRTELAKYGISFAFQETSEVLGNVTGGAKRGAAYDGLTQMALQLDTKRAFGWYGGTFNVSALQIHGNNLSASNLLTLQTASGIEADRATRLWELWYQQKFLEEDRLDIKVGQQSLDQEFMVKPTAPISSTRCSAGRWCRRRICPAAVRPIRCRPWACGRVIARSIP